MLVDSKGRTQIVGFSVAGITAGVGSGQTTSNRSVGTQHLSAPEVLKGGENDRKADVFSFAMVAIEVRHM